MWTKTLNHFTRLGAVERTVFRVRGKAQKRKMIIALQSVATLQCARKTVQFGFGKKTKKEGSEVFENDCNIHWVIIKNKWSAEGYRFNAFLLKIREQDTLRILFVSNSKH